MDDTRDTVADAAASMIATTVVPIREMSAGRTGATLKAKAVDVSAPTADPKVKICKARARWTRTKRNAFLDHLAATCDVKGAAKLVGVASADAHALRRSDPAFADAWSAALEQGYDHIETQLLARAIGQAPDPAVPFDPDMGLRVLAARKRSTGGNMGSGRPRAPAPTRRVTIEQVEASLRRKLDALAKRMRSRGAKGAA